MPSRRVVRALLNAESTAVSVKSTTGTPVVETLTESGSSINLVSALQTRNGARIVIAGSLSLFSNRLFSTSVDGSLSGNAEFCSCTAQWVFGDRSVLRVRELTHVAPETGAVPSAYRIGDNITVTAVIDEFRNGDWSPYVADDIQFELVMLDPYWRVTIPMSSTPGVYKFTERLPDVFGVYKLRLSYHRWGFTQLDSEADIPVRPYRHNEYDRFLIAAMPYYTTVLCTCGAFLVFSALFLYTPDRLTSVTKATKSD